MRKGRYTANMVLVLHLHCTPQVPSRLTKVLQAREKERAGHQSEGQLEIQVTDGRLNQSSRQTQDSRQTEGRLNQAQFQPVLLLPLKGPPQVITSD